MRRVLIIGNAGSGKSTFARKLAEKTGLPLVHLDKLYWHGNWEHLSREEFDTAMQTELEKDAWRSYVKCSCYGLVSDWLANGLDEDGYIKLRTIIEKTN